MEDESTRVTKDGLLDGTMASLDLISPWIQSGQICCNESYFDSVSAAEELLNNGLCFIGVVKMASSQMKWLAEQQLGQYGD